LHVAGSEAHGSGGWINGSISLTTVDMMDDSFACKKKNDFNFSSDPIPRDEIG